STWTQCSTSTCRPTRQISRPRSRAARPPPRLPPDPRRRQSLRSARSKLRRGLGPGPGPPGTRRRFLRGPTWSASCPERFQQALDRLLARAHAIGDADAAVGAAHEGETRMAPHALLDGLHARQVADMVLGHGLRVARDAGEERVPARPQELGELAPGGGREVLVALL